MAKLKLPFILILILCVFNACNIEPFEGETPDPTNLDKPESCQDAIQLTIDAGIAYTQALSAGNATGESCLKYKMAVEYQIELCGDTGGNLQLLLDSLDCGDGNTDGGGTGGAFAFMTANINGTIYNDMKPNSYLFFPGGADVNDYFSRSDDDYIRIQGNSGYKKPTVIEDTDREINLRIPSALWKEGTYTLYDDLNDVFEGVCFYTFFGLDWANGVNTRGLPGEITITKFSLDERVIQGIFQFEYMMEYENGSSVTVEGPFEVTGTFDYALDDEFFD